MAGGGSFLTFPALVFTGVAPVAANATSAVALWPGSVASAYAYRKDLRQAPALLVALGAASVVGGGLGGVVLLRTPDALFVRVLPYLLLFATLVFSFGPAVTARLGKGRGAAPVAGGGAAPRPSLRALVVGGLVQLAISLYGGYFGGGMGILMLAAFSVLDLGNIHGMNAVKTLLAALINGVAIAAFIAAGKVVWGPGAVMVAGGLIGGYGGARLARALPALRVRRFVLVVAWGMTAYFFFRAHAPSG